MIEFWNLRAKELRKANNLRAGEIAEKLGISKNTLSNWETGKIKPNRDKIIKLAKAIGIQVNEISNIEHIDETSEVDFIGTYEDLLNSYNELGNSEASSNLKNIFNKLVDIKEQISNYEVVINAIRLSSLFIFSVKDVNLKFIMTNNGFLDNLGLPLDTSTTGKQDIDFFSPSETQINEEMDLFVLKNKQPLITEGSIPGSKKKKWGSLIKVPLFDKENKVLGVFSSYQDITERKKSEATKEMLEQSLKSFFKRILIMTFNPTELVFYNTANTPYFEEFKKSPTPLRDVIECFVHEDDQPKELEYWKNKQWPKRCVYRMYDILGDLYEYTSDHQVVNHMGTDYYVFIMTEKILEVGAREPFDFSKLRK